MSDRRELKRAMRRLGITQAAVAKQIGRHSTSVSNALAGRFKSRPIMAAVEAMIAERERANATQGITPVR